MTSPTPSRKTGRARFSERRVLATLIWQGEKIRCFRCKEPFNLDPSSPHYVYMAEREHIHEIKLDGPDEPANCRYSAKQCHAVITCGTPVTSAGSSHNRIAKTKGIRVAKFVPVKRPLDEDVGVLATVKCRKCGEYVEECACPVPHRQQTFRRQIGARNG